MLTKKQQLVGQLIERTSSSDAATQLQRILETANKVGINLEVAEIAFIENLAALTVDYAVRIGATAKLEAAVSPDSAKPGQKPLDYGKFDPAYVSKCRGMHGGGLF